MKIYRITGVKFATDLSGTGGLYASGRWHKQGTHIIYTSEHVSLAKLEVLANSTTTPENVVLVTLEVPTITPCLTLTATDLPLGWDAPDYLPNLVELTEKWLFEKTYLLMRVPSVHSPTEFNYLINPLHELHKTVEIISIEPHPFDPRLKEIKSDL